MSLVTIDGVEKMTFGEIVALAEAYVSDRDTSRLARDAADWFTTSW